MAACSALAQGQTVSLQEARQRGNALPPFWRLLQRLVGCGQRCSRSLSVTLGCIAAERTVRVVGMSASACRFQQTSVK